MTDDRLQRDLISEFGSWKAECGKRDAEGEIGARGKLRIVDRHLNCSVYSVYDLID